MCWETRFQLWLTEICVLLETHFTSRTDSELVINYNFYFLNFILIFYFFIIGYRVNVTVSEMKNKRLVTSEIKSITKSALKSYITNLNIL